MRPSNKIKFHSNSTTSEIYTSILNRLHTLHLNSSAVKDVDDYTNQFQNIDTELKKLDAEVAMPEAYMIHLYLTGLGAAFEIFHISYIQCHSFFGESKVSFGEVARAARNEEQRQRAYKGFRKAMFAGPSSPRRGSC